MNWKIAAIVLVTLLSLTGIGGCIYGAYKISTQMVVAQSLSECNNPDPDRSIAGCSALLQSRFASNSNRIAAYYRRSRAYDSKADYDHAIADQTQIIQLNPKEAFAYNSRGLTYQKKGDLDHALADFDTAIQKFPEQPIGWFNRGEAYQAKGDYPQALADFTHVIQLDPRNAVAWNNRCYFRAVSTQVPGQLQQALADCNQSLLLKPNVPYTLDSRAFTYLKLRQYDLAIRDYNAALAVEPNKAIYLYGRGLARQAKHDAAGSKSDLDAAKNLDPKIVDQFKKYGLG